MHHDDSTHGGGGRHRREEAAAAPLTEREKLIVRLEHARRHHGEHAAGYRGLAEAAERIGAAEAARILRGVAEEAAKQMLELDKALAALGRPIQP